MGHMSVLQSSDKLLIKMEVFRLILPLENSDLYERVCDSSTSGSEVNRTSCPFCGLSSFSIFFLTVNISECVT